MPTILIVEDELMTLEILGRTLLKEGHTVYTADNIKKAKTIIRKKKEVDLILLDRLLPDGDGLTICRQFKNNVLTRHTPIIILTNKKDFQDELQAYKFGADLFLPKPVELKRLKEYARALMTRSPDGNHADSLFQNGPVTIDVKSHHVAIKGHPLPKLPPKLFNLFYFIATNRGPYVKRRILIWKIWRNKVRDKELDVAIHRIRKHLGPKWSGLIKSENGKGYALSNDFLTALPPQN